MDGVGAVVISPTRELALQTFNCLSKFANKHEMSAGLIIGGTTFEREQVRIPFTNILIATPGRLLQHMDETPNFDCLNLQMLVLDEVGNVTPILRLTSQNGCPPVQLCYGCCTASLWQFAPAPSATLHPCHVVVCSGPKCVHYRPSGAWRRHSGPPHGRGPALLSPRFLLVFRLDAPKSGN
jgi:hypothetical protein